MAKQSNLKIAVVIALTMAASSSYAATSIVGATDLGGGSFTPSNKVSISVATNGTSTSFDGTSYGAVSKHSSGDKNVASNSVDSKLYFKTAAVTSSVVAASSGMTFDTSWTSM
jgi:hypothetical protein